MLAISVYGQDKEHINAKASFDNRDYVGAISQYKKALRKTIDFTEQQQIAYGIAMSYFYMNDYKNAADWFEDAIGDHTNNVQSYFYYAQVLVIENKFIEAKSILKRAKVQNPDNFEIDKRIASIDLIIDRKVTDTLEEVTQVPLINSEYSDYGIGSWNDGIVFSSTRKEKVNQRTDGRTGQGFSDLYFSKYNESKKKWSQPESMSKTLNTLFNDGAFTYDDVNDIAYWTTCTEKPGSCLIYSSKFNIETKKWTKPTKVSFMNPHFSYGHPYISENGNTLYFTSNMTGGYGKNDIWKITRKEDDSWGVPINLGENINTAKNDMFPSVYGDTLLFYSSDGLNSFGGLDIYFSIKRGISFTKPVTVGLPLNSAADDFSLLISSFGDGGFFCSNRNLLTSDDIYQFKGFPIKITVQGKVLHEIDNKPIADALVLSTNEDDITDTIITDPSGKYVINLDAYEKYRITVLKDSFFKEEKVINTAGNALIFNTAPQVELDFYLIKKSYPCGIKGFVTNKESNEPMADVKVEISNKAGFSTYVRTNQMGGYMFDGLKPNTIYTIKTGESGFFSESRVCTLPKVNKAMIFSRSNGYDMDFQLFQIQTKNEVTLSNIYYDFNKATLRETSKIELNRLASMLMETPNIIIQINAHSDSRGRSEYNLRLSADRANSVVNYLIVNGVNRDRLIAKGYGESKLLIQNAQSEDEHQANRRTTFQVIAEGEIAIQDGTIPILPKVLYRVQIVTTGIPCNLTSDFDDILENIDNINIYQIDAGTIYKYEVGNRNNFEEANKLKVALRSLGYNDCFVVSYYNDKKISVSKAKELEGGVQN